MNEWKEYKLGEIADVQTGPFGSQLHQSDYVSVGVPSIMPLNIGNRMDISTDKIAYITEEDATRLARYRVKEGDIVYSRRGDVEKCAYIKEKESGWLCGTGCLRIRIDSKKADSKFVAYYLSTDEMKIWISNNAVGTTMPNLNSSILQQVPLSLPSIEEQRRIASILTSLDDKIDLLRRENATLEAMAETLFRQWFVEEAKEDWEEKPLKEFVDIAIGRTPPRKESKWFSTNPTDIKWLSIKDMGGDAVFLFNTSEYLTKEAVKAFSIPIIPKDTVVLSFKMTVGRVGITTEDMLSNEAIAHFKFKNNTPFSKEYLYIFLKTYKYETLGSTSSIVTAINSAMIKNMGIVLPDAETMEKFRCQTQSMFDKIYDNQKQIQTLIQTRDGLLPRLMSGELKV
jgi:type I restriction enzyme S subunit